MALQKPNYANIPGDILYNKSLPPAARDTYCQIRGLAWGKTETKPISMQDLIDVTGKSQSTMYEHMRLLRHVGALLWRSPSNSTFIFSFKPIGGLGHSEKSESLNRVNKIHITDLRGNDSIKTHSEKSETKNGRKKNTKNHLEDYLE